MIVYLSFIFVTLVLLLNVLIAQMTNTHKTVQESLHQAYTSSTGFGLFAQGRSNRSGQSGHGLTNIFVRSGCVQEDARARADAFRH